MTSFYDSLQYFWKALPFWQLSFRPEVSVLLLSPSPIAFPQDLSVESLGVVKVKETNFSPNGTSMISLADSLPYFWKALLFGQLSDHLEASLHLFSPSPIAFPHCSSV
jgi:hypothetical protein